MKIGSARPLNLLTALAVFVFIFDWKTFSLLVVMWSNSSKKVSTKKLSSVQSSSSSGDKGSMDRGFARRLSTWEALFLRPTGGSGLLKAILDI